MITPAIQFNGNCEEALNFYEVVFKGTDKYVEYYRDAPEDSGIPKTEETSHKVMHSGITLCGTYINMCDAEEEVMDGNRMKLNVFMNTDEEVIRAFKMLKEGGKVIVDLGPQFFSSMYASVEDRFGLRWQLIANEG